MMKKVLLVAGMALFGTSLFCDILVTNQTGDTVLVTVEGVTKKLIPDAKEKFTVKIKDGKTADGVKFSPKNTMVKWIRLHGPVPVVYRSKEIPVPKDIFLRPDGGAYITWTWTGLLDAPKENTGLIADEISEKYEGTMKEIEKALKSMADLHYKNKDYASKAADLGKKVERLYMDLATKDSSSSSVSR